MYGFVMYNLSGIQKGIQFCHAAVEYSRLAAKHKAYANYFDFADNHKTFILLDGGSSNDMQYNRRAELDGLNIPYAQFNEPDLNNSVSAITFILPQDVYSIDLNNPGVEGDTDYARRYAIKSYISKFRLASN